MSDFSKPELMALFETEVRKRMEPPFLMSRTQAEMLVAVIMTSENIETTSALSSQYGGSQ